MVKHKDLKGKRFSRLLVLEAAGTDKWHRQHWTCRCDCGNIVDVVSRFLITGDRVSCGCALAEHRKSIGGMNKTHGESRCDNRLYRIWQAMKNRCRNPKTINYAYYGGRGIMVCIEWNESYESFKNWAYMHGYNDELTIDRIDPNGNYEPNNCRWISIQEQQRNKRNTKKANA